MTTRLLAAASLCLLAAACTSAPPTYYVLSPLPATERQTPSTATAVMRVRMPDYLERMEIVSRNGANALKVDEDNQWGEPLWLGVGRVLSEDLSRLLPGARVFTPDEGRGHAARYEYIVNFEAFESDGRQAVASGRWVLRPLGNGAPLAEGRFDQSRPVAADGAGAVVAGLNEALHQVARTIAASSAGALAP